MVLCLILSGLFVPVRSLTCYFLNVEFFFLGAFTPFVAFDSEELNVGMGVMDINGYYSRHCFLGF